LTCDFQVTLFHVFERPGFFDLIINKTDIVLESVNYRGVTGAGWEAIEGTLKSRVRNVAVVFGCEMYQ
jgi:hypothetical protein